MNTLKVVITGGPGTGKSSIINELKNLGHSCLEEISRQITLDAKKKGIEQLFLSDPLLFSEHVLEGRLNQFNESSKKSQETVFIDRGIPDILGYLDYAKTSYPKHFTEACMNNKYDYVFYLEPWEAIFTKDSIRYETFEESQQVDQHLKNTYLKFNYNLIIVPVGSVYSRAQFILNTITKS